MSSVYWGVTIVAFCLALLPGLLARGRWERVALIVATVSAGAWIAVSGVIFGTREQLYGGGNLVMMGLMPAILCVWALAAVGAGMGVNRGARALGMTRGSMAIAIVAGVTIAVALPLALAIAGLSTEV